MSDKIAGMFHRVTISRTLRSFSVLRTSISSAVFASLLCVAGLSGTASAQGNSTVEFRDDFGNGNGLYGSQPGYWDRSPYTEYKSKASGAPGAFNLGKTEWGRGIDNVAVNLSPFPNYSPPSLDVGISTFGGGTDNSGRGLVKGSEIKTNRYFNPPQVGQAVDFEIRVALYSYNPVPGTIFGFYLYEDERPNSGPIRYSDEIDFEYLGNKPNEILTTAWNNWQRYAGGNRDGQDVIGNYGSSTPGNQSPNHNGESHPIPVDSHKWHYAKIRWIRTGSGFVVEWYMKGDSDADYGPPIRQVTNVQVDQPMQVHFNFWAPGYGTFDEASGEYVNSPFDKNSNPTKFNEAYIDYLQVTRINNVSPALARTSPPTAPPTVSPAAGVAPVDTAPSSFGASLTPYGPNTNAYLTATPVISNPQNYDFTYRFTVNGQGVQDGTNPQLNLSIPGYGDHGDNVGVVITARERNTGNYSYATNNANVVNTAPTAENVTVTTGSGREVIIPLSGADIDGDPLTFQRVGGPINGTGGIFLDIDGRYKMRYTSRSNFTGTETVQFVSKDSYNRTSAVATMTINVTSGGAS